jgi:hypothetical protein
VSDERTSRVHLNDHIEAASQFMIMGNDDQGASLLSIDLKQEALNL